MGSFIWNISLYFIRAGWLKENKDEIHWIRLYKLGVCIHPRFKYYEGENKK